MVPKVIHSSYMISKSFNSKRKIELYMFCIWNRGEGSVDVIKIKRIVEKANKHVKTL